MLMRVSFENPNQLEDALARRTRRFESRHGSLLCFDQSVTFCTPINTVQTTFSNRSGTNSQYTAAELARLFDDGFQIAVGSYSGFVSNACHQEVELALERLSQPAPDVGSPV